MGHKKLTSLEHFQSGLQRSREFAGEVAETAAAAIEEIDNEKMQKSNSVSIMIPTTGWKDDSSNAEYPKYYDIPITDVTAADLALVFISPESQTVANNCVMNPLCNTIEGAVRINAQKTPSSVISAEIRIFGGAV